MDFDTIFDESTIKALATLAKLPCGAANLSECQLGETVGYIFARYA